MEYNAKDVGIRIAKLRIERGMSQEELGEILGVSPKHISNVERGEYGLSLEGYLKVSKVFSVSLDYLITGALEMPLNDCVRELVEEGSAEEQEAVWKFLRTLLHLKKKP